MLEKDIETDIERKRKELEKLFPSIFKDGYLDVDMLKQEIGEEIEEKRRKV